LAILVAALAACGQRTGPRLSDREPAGGPRISAEQARQEAFCAAFGKVLSAQSASFMPVRGPSLDRKVWLASVRLPGMRHCTVTTHVKPVYECRASEGEWGAQSLLRQEFEYFARLVDNCLAADGGSQKWYESNTSESPPGLAKFYKKGQTQIYLSTNQDVRSRLYFTSLRIEE
jgi:hypothetical protein